MGKLKLKQIWWIIYTITVYLGHIIGGVYMHVSCMYTLHKFIIWSIICSKVSYNQLLFLVSDDLELFNVKMATLWNTNHKLFFRLLHYNSPSSLWFINRRARLHHQ